MIEETSREYSDTEEQEAIIQAGRRSGESLMIDAYAGVGKTTTLARTAPGIKVPSLALAFNKSIKDELGKRFPPNFQVQSMNGLGYGALRRAMPEIGTWKIDDRKIGKLVTEVAKEWKQDLGEDGWAAAREMVRKAQLSGIVPNGAGASPLRPDDEASWGYLADLMWLGDDERMAIVSLAREVLIRSNELVAGQGVISFDDQVYYSTCVSGRFPLFPVVMVDEAQDLSPLMHAMLGKTLRPDGRLIAVGDRRQSIYAFRGADSDSIGKIAKLRSNWLNLSLSVSFRCPKVIVKRQQSHAPGFRFADWAPEGKAGKAGRKGAEDLWEWSWGDVVDSLPSPSASLAVLCRNNAPLVKLAFRLLRQRVPVQMAGRDIGQGLVALVKKLGEKGENEGVGTLLGALDEWEQTESSKAMLMGNDDKATEISDRAESLRAVMELGEVSNRHSLLLAIEGLFNRDGRVLLSTIHRAKGLEWDLVLHLDPWRVSGRRAKDAGGMILEQEMNLLYVAETRTRNVLLNASLEDFRG